MANKRNRLRDAIYVRTSSYTKQPNGDIIETVDSINTFRAYVQPQEQALIDRTFDIPMSTFDYVVKMRSESFKASGIVSATRVTTSKTGNKVFQVVDIVESTLRETIITLKAT